MIRYNQKETNKTNTKKGIKTMTNNEIIKATINYLETKEVWTREEMKAYYRLKKLLEEDKVGK